MLGTFSPRTSAGLKPRSSEPAGRARMVSAWLVSITRVPAKLKQQEVPQGGGLKVRTDLGAPSPRPGPPPLLRVAGGQPQRPALPPMPRLKLGGQRAPTQGLRFQQPPNIRIPGTNGMMTMIKTQQSPGIVKPQQVPGGMPIITNSMSLRYVTLISLDVRAVKLNIFQATET